jgi:predicted NUDIX family phosphoesterase
MGTNRVLVFPREIFHDAFSLLPWDSIQEEIEEIEKAFAWLERPDAERSTDLVQAIPCAFIRDHDGKCCVLRRVQNARDDLNEKLSLIVGGHVDELPYHPTFKTAMSVTLERELEEEVGIIPVEPSHPVGVIIDNSSVEASRHVAFLHETTAERVSTKAKEEFKIRSSLTGEFMAASELAWKRDDFDPWSKLLIEEHICPGDVRPKPRQFSFL